MAYCFEKAKTPVVSQRRNTVALYQLLHALKATIRPAVSYSELSKSSTPIREVWMHPHYFASYDMVETSFPDELYIPTYE